MEYDVKSLEPIFPLIKEYFGNPYIEFQDYPEAFPFKEVVTSDAIEELLLRYFEKDQVTKEVLSLLWLVANLYYCGNIEAREQGNYWDVDDWEQKRIIREEIAQLYSFITERGTLRIPKNKQYYPREGGEIEFKSQTGTLKILDTECWIEALLENYLFPNCLPDVSNDEEAQLIWKKENKPAGRKARKTVNAIIHGVDMFLHDQGVVDRNVAAPKSLCLFIYDYLETMGLLDYLTEDNKEKKSEPWYIIQKQIPYFRKEENNPKLFTPELEECLPEEWIGNPRDDAAYQWLYYPNRIKKEEKKTIGARIDLLLSHIRDIFRKGVYKKGKKENTSQS